MDGATAYREARVLGRTPEQLVGLPYQHLPTRLLRARALMPEGDIEARGQNLELGLEPDRDYAERRIGRISGLHASWSGAASAALAMTAGPGGAP